MPDQVGWGKSSKPDARYSFGLLARNTARLLDTLGVREAVVIGHSTGGMLAVRFARTYADRVTRLVLEDPIGLEDYRDRIPPQTDETLFRAELANTDPAAIRAFFARYFARPRPELSDPLAQPYVRVTRSGGYPRWARASARAAMGQFPALARAAARDLPRGAAVVVPDAGHIPHIEQPDAFLRAVLAFLAPTGAGAPGASAGGGTPPGP